MRVCALFTMPSWRVARERKASGFSFVISCFGGGEGGGQGQEEEEEDQRRCLTFWLINRREGGREGGKAGGILRPRLPPAEYSDAYLPRFKESPCLLVISRRKYLRRRSYPYCRRFTSRYDRGFVNRASLFGGYPLSNPQKSV